MMTMMTITMAREVIVSEVIIKARCPNCGDIELTPPGVWLCQWPNRALSYDFWCEHCYQWTRKWELNNAVVELLARAGVTPYVCTPPEELSDPRRFLITPLTEVDVAAALADIETC